MQTHFHLTARPIRKGRAASKARYVQRLEGHEHLEDLHGAGAGNLPPWAAKDAVRFFRYADKYERKNGTAAMEIEVALPRVLPHAIQKLLIAELVARLYGAEHAYCYGFHINKSSDGGTNPHAHLLGSEREDDGLCRPAERYFSRAVGRVRGVPTRDPRLGGCPKSRRFALFARAGKGFAASPNLLKLRSWWAGRCNYYLKRFGIADLCSERSYKARHIDRTPGVHMFESGRRIASRGGHSRRVTANAEAMAENVLKAEAVPRAENAREIKRQLAAGTKRPMPAAPKPSSTLGSPDPAAAARDLRDALKSLSEEEVTVTPRRRRITR